MIERNYLMVGDYVTVEAKITVNNNATKTENYGIAEIATIGRGDYFYVKMEGGEEKLQVSTNLKPIPITEELLESSAMGFSKDKFIVSGDEYVKHNGKFHVRVGRFSNTPDRKWYCHIDNSVYESVGGGDIQYLHELQNLFRVLTGTDLEISLL